MRRIKPEVVNEILTIDYTVGYLIIEIVLFVKTDYQFTINVAYDVFLSMPGKLKALIIYYLAFQAHIKTGYPRF
jgi:hypothetical protein